MCIHLLLHKLFSAVWIYAVHTNNIIQGQIGLVGVSAEARGRGVGHALVNHALDWFTRNDVEAVAVVTQGGNVAAQRLYQRCGFLTESVQLWYHKWMPYGATGEG